MALGFLDNALGLVMLDRSQMKCTKCRLHETAKSVRIDGRGSDNPRVMFVGFGPGEVEDEQGKVFVGPAGQLLHQAIREYNLCPSFLSNVVRCRTPGDRDPRKDEIEACKDHLKEEIKRLHPEIIVALGKIPLKLLTKKSKMTAYSGEIAGNVNGARVFGLFHPSYVLRYARNLPKFEMHLRGLQSLLNGGKEAKKAITGSQKAISASRNGILEPTLEEAAEILRTAKDYVTFDYETTGLWKQFGGSMRCVGFHASGINMVVEPDPDFMRKFLTSDIKKCAFNSVFERRWSYDEFGVEPKNLVYDPMLMSYLLDENTSHDLESVAGTHLKAEKWDIKATMLENDWDYDTVPDDILRPYCGKDVDYTHKLAFLLLEKITEQGLLGIYKDIMLPLSRLCSRLESRGMKIDTEWAEEKDKEYGVECDNLREEMRRYVNLPDNFNPNSTQQIGKIIFDKLKLKTKIKSKKTGKMSTAIDALEPIKHKHPFIPPFLEWKEKQNHRDKYLQEFPQWIGEDGLIHPSFNPCFIVTGRLSVTKPAAQTIPKEPKVRGMFISRFPGGKILAGDFDQLELRLVASEAGEENLIRVFKEGKDPHNVTAEKMFGAGFTDEERNIAKSLNFGLDYGLTEYGLIKNFPKLKMSRDEAIHLISRYRKAYPRLFTWMSEQHAFFKRHGYIKSRTGQMRRFPEYNHSDDWQQARILRQVGNFPIQNLGAHINNLTGIDLDNRMLWGGQKSLLFHLVHDEILIDLYPGEYEDVITLCNQTVIQRVQEYSKVPLTMSFEVSDRWGGSDEK